MWFWPKSEDLGATFFWVLVIVVIILIIFFYLFIRTKFPCYLCKDKVTTTTWKKHRIDCGRENAWFIQGLPESKV